MTVDNPEWDRWFSTQYDITEHVRVYLKEQLKDEHPMFAAAVYAGVIETMTEDMRMKIVLPHHPLREVLTQIWSALDADNQTDTQKLTNIDKILTDELNP